MGSKDSKTDSKYVYSIDGDINPSDGRSQETLEVLEDLDSLLKDIIKKKKHRKLVREFIETAVECAEADALNYGITIGCYTYAYLVEKYKVSKENPPTREQVQEAFTKFQLEVNLGIVNYQ